MNMDLVLQADRLPQTGESYFGSDYRYIPGGKGANQATAAARLGAQVTFVGRVGDDPHGQVLKRSLAEEGIETSGISVDTSHSTGLAVIFVEPSGENRIMVFAGANMEMKPEDAEMAFVRNEGRPFDAVMMNFEIPDDVLFPLCSRAAKAGTPVVIDAGPARAFPLEKLEGVTILSPNETEAEALTGIDCGTDAGAEAAAVKLKERCDAEWIVLKLGMRGALLYGESTVSRVPAFGVRAVDATAAGDAFTAGLAVHYVSTKDIRQALAFGTAAGAITVTRLGAQPSLPSKEEVTAFLTSQV